MPNTAAILAALPWAALTFAIWLSFALVRRFAPKLWTVPALHALYDWAVVMTPPDALKVVVPLLNAVWTAWEALPAVLVGAIFTTVQSGGDVRQAWIGAAAGVLAVPLHHLLKALPFVPYQGQLGSPPKTIRIPGGTLVLCIAAALAGDVTFACSGNLPTAQDVARSRDALKGAYAKALVVQQTIGDVRAGLDVALPNPTEAQKATLDLIDIHLANAAAGLNDAGPWIETGAGEAAGKRGLRKALEGLLAAQRLAATLGGKPLPQVVTDTLELGLVALGPSEAEAADAGAEAGPAPEP